MSETGQSTQPMRLLRSTSERSVLATLGSGPIRASQIIDATGLTRPTVDQALRSLTAKKWVEVSGPGEHQLGRPAQRYARRVPRGYLAGVDIGLYEIRVSLRNLSGTIVSHNAVAVSPQHSVAERLAAVPTALAAAHAALGQPRSVAWLTTAGVTTMAAEDWTSADLTAALRQTIPTPLEASNSADVLARTEAVHGLGRHRRVVLLVWLGRRPTMALTVDGRLHTGARGLAGDISFVTGWSTESGRPTGSRTGRAIPTADAFARVVEAAALRADDAARARLRAWFDEILPSIALLAAALDPDLVILGGPVARLGESLIAPTVQALAASTRSPAEVAVQPFSEYLMADRASLDALHRVTDVLIHGGDSVGSYTRADFVRIWRGSYCSS